MMREFCAGGFTGKMCWIHTMRVLGDAGFTGCACFVPLDSRDARVFCCWIHMMRVFCAAGFT
jgi:hypothetical protein